MVFHSFCRAMSLSDVDFNSVLSCNAFAFSTSARFLSAFSLNVSLSVLKYSALRPKKSSHVARKRSKILTFIFCGAKPIVFHSACMAIISFVWRSQSPEPLFSSAAMALAFSHKAVLRARFSSSFELLEMLLVALVDYSRCSLEAYPYLFAQFFGYGAYFPIFGM